MDTPRLATVASITGFQSGRREGSVIVAKTTSGGALMVLLAEPLRTTTGFKLVKASNSSLVRERPLAAAELAIRERCMN
jgi:hypothetical protein